jgi:hypothetical protein
MNGQKPPSPYRGARYLSPYSVKHLKYKASLRPLTGIKPNSTQISQTSLACATLFQLVRLSPLKHAIDPPRARRWRMHTKHQSFQTVSGLMML